jgi:hypothetical protein
MLIPALLVLQVAAQVPDTATYSSPALRQLVEEASRLNSQVPATLGRYRANLESEISYGGRAGDREMSVSFEQTASTLDWKRDGSFEQHLIGYRSQSIGPSMATIGFFESSWAVPALYGNRLSLLFGVDSARSRQARARAQRQSRTSTPYVAVHPLSVDRERYYRYAGGDTVLELRVDNREIRIARIDVTPRPDIPPGTYFTGEVDVDVERRHVVRMRGSFVSNRRPGGTALGRLLQFDAIAYVELVNAEVEGKYWLPSFQRFEGHAFASTITSSTAIFRIVSRFRDYTITPPGPAVGVAETDTLVPRAHRLSRAGPDSMSKFAEWRDEIGAVTATVAASDFDSVAPPRWRAYGPPVVIAQVERFSDFVRFNRVEGLYTGLGFTARMRDMAPGVTVRGTAGYAWSESAVRGRLSVERDRGRGTFRLSAGRSLDPTNDFYTTFDSTSAIGALFGVDNVDYVDRRSLSFAVGLRSPRTRWGYGAEYAVVDDRNARVNVTRSPLGGPEYFANRHVDEKRYTRQTYTLQYNPLVQAEYMRPGVGATLRYQNANSFYRRTQLSLNARTNQRRWTFATRLDAGEVRGVGEAPVPFDSAGASRPFSLRGTIPTQQLFEMGGASTLPGYEYKEFAGNQMALLRGIAMFRLNILQSPIRFTQRVWLPEPSPALSFSIQSGWTGASNQDARDAITRLGPRYLGDTLALASYAPASTLTGNARTTIAVGVRFFGGTIGVVVARPVDRAAPWKLQLAAGQLF